MIASEPRGNDLLLLTLQRPEKRNALTPALIAQLTAELRRSEADPAIRGIIVAGAGPSFCAGVDLHEFASGSPDSARVLIEALRSLCATVRLLSKPVACAIHGHCLGGALELAACADFRVATADAQLGMPEVVLGLPSVIDAVMLGHLIGVGRAREGLARPLNTFAPYHQWRWMCSSAAPLCASDLGVAFGICRPRRSLSRDGTYLLKK